MNTEQTCYLFLDFDGTVFIKGRIPPENREALEAVQKLGHQLILNTGRSRGGLDFSLAEHQGVRWDGMIFGASDMTYRGRRYHDHTVPENLVLEWVRYGMAHHYWVHLEGESHNQWYAFDKHQGDFTPEEVERVLLEVREQVAESPVTKLSLRCVDEGDMPEGGLRLIRQKTYAELFPDGRDKGVAFLEFCELYRIPKEQCVCFGDSLNDLAIFQACPNSVAMCGAPELLRRHATYCAVGACGVAEGIRQLFGQAVENHLRHGCERSGEK